MFELWFYYYGEPYRSSINDEQSSKAFEVLCLDKCQIFNDYFIIYMKGDQEVKLKYLH